MNEAIETAINKVKDALRKEGFVNCPYVDGGEGLHLPFSNRHNVVFLGTYLNSFSLPCEGEDPNKPLFWQDLIGYSGAVIKVDPVYRHNGTRYDVSISVSVDWYDAKPYKWIPSPDFYKPAEKAIVKAESPTDYISQGWKWSTNCCIKCDRLVKVRADALTDRKIANIVKKVKEALEGYTCPDYSHLEEDAALWHKDTSSEYSAWIAAHKISPKVG